MDRDYQLFRTPTSRKSQRSSNSLACLSHRLLYPGHRRAKTNIDVERLFKALTSLHDSISKMLRDSDAATELPVRAKSQHSGYAKCRARGLALLDVALSYENAQDFQDHVDADLHRIAKVARLSTHVNEATESSKRKVALDVLDGLDEEEKVATEANVERKSTKIVKQWQIVAGSRTVSNKQISTKFSRLYRDSRIILTAEYVTDLAKYESDVEDLMRLSAAKDRSYARRSAEDKLAMKVINGLKPAVRKELLERAEALGLEMMKEFIEGKQKTG